MATIRHCPLIALGVFSPAAHLKAVLVPDFSWRERALLTSEQEEGGRDGQQTKDGAYTGDPNRLTVVLVAQDAS